MTARAGHIHSVINVPHVTRTRERAHSVVAAGMFVAVMAAIRTLVTVFAVEGAQRNVVIDVDIIGHARA